jgi:integrase
MRKVRIFKRQDRPGWYISWRESGSVKKRALPDKKLAEHYASIKYHELNMEVFRSQFDLPWPDLVDRYMRTYDVRRLAQSSKYDSNLTLRHFERLLGQFSSKNITQDMFDEYIILRAEKLSEWTLNKEISNLRAFIRWGQKNFYLSKELEIHKVKATPRTPVSLTETQVHSLLESARQRSECWYIRVLLAVTTGLRSGDIDSLTIRDIDFETNSVCTRSKKTRKSMSARPLHTHIMPILSRYVAELPAGQVKLLSDTNTFKKWKKVRDRAGLPNLRFHDLRSVFSSALQSRDVPLSVVQSLLEHSSPGLTAKTYTNTSPMLAPAVERLPVKEWLT